MNKPDNPYLLTDPFLDVVSDMLKTFGRKGRLWVKIDGVGIGAFEFPKDAPIQGKRS